MKQIVFWQNTPSIHQAPFIKALSARLKCEISVISETSVPPDRVSIGWKLPDFSPAHLVIAPDKKERQALIDRYKGNDVVHLFSGISAYPDTYLTLKEISKSKSIIGVSLESGNISQGIKSALRLLRDMYLSLQWQRRVNFMLAMGELGCRWYQKSGFPQKKIFPFGYFVDPELRGAGLRGDTGNHHIKLLYVGQLIDRKGVDLLLGALKEGVDDNWQLDIVGDGVQRESLESLAVSLGINNRINWLGAMSNSNVRDQMLDADILVLPSRFDGWGAVVNEALMTGIPSIVSDACGAADLVGSWRGTVFKSGSIMALRRAIRHEMRRCPHDFHSRIIEWSKETISPEIAAEYFIEIINYTMHGGARPVAPWLSYDS